MFQLAVIGTRQPVCDYREAKHRCSPRVVYGMLRESDDTFPQKCCIRKTWVRANDMPLPEFIYVLLFFLSMAYAHGVLVALNCHVYIIFSSYRSCINEATLFFFLCVCVCFPRTPALCAPTAGGNVPCAARDQEEEYVGRQSDP